jgi:hypothetical protein
MVGRHSRLSVFTSNANALAALILRPYHSVRQSAVGLRGCVGRIILLATAHIKLMQLPRMRRTLHQSSGKLPRFVLHAKKTLYCSA